MITLDEFEHVQRLLGRPGVPRKTRSFAFTGMIRCGECGFAVTGEEKTNRWGQQFTYYHCTKRRLDRRCTQRYVPLEEIEDQILEFLEEITLPKRFHEWALARIQRSTAEKARERTAQRESLLYAQAATARELEILTKLRIRDLLTDEEFLKQRQELERRQIGITQQLKGFDQNDERFEPSRSLISLNSSLVSRFKVADLQEKRLILTIVGSNLLLKDENLNIDARKPFRRWSKTSTLSEMRAFVRDVRTLATEQTAEALQIFSAVSKLLNE
jgi:site-specific DNA recombinase